MDTVHVKIHRPQAPGRLEKHRPKKIPPRGQETVNMDLQIYFYTQKVHSKVCQSVSFPATMLKFPDFTCLIHQKNSPLSAARVQASGAGLGNPQWDGGPVISSHRMERGSTNKNNTSQKLSPINIQVCKPLKHD